MTPSGIDVRPEAAEFLKTGRPVVALESTLIAHGLPWPTNLETARAAEQAVRETGAVPATIAVWKGRPTVGLADDEIEQLAHQSGALKASRRDLGAAVALKATAATTVAATMALAHLVGIRVFATGGIGGVHPHRPGSPLDISADLIELGRTPVAVVCAGAKSILDLPATLEFLETHGVPVLGFGTDEFPAFYLTGSGLPVPIRVDAVRDAAEIAATHWQLGGGGLVLACPLPEEEAIEPVDFARAMGVAQGEADRQQVHGAALTPFLLARVAEHTGGRTLRANQALIVRNARLAGQLAGALCEGS